MRLLLSASCTCLMLLSINSARAAPYEVVPYLSGTTVITGGTESYYWSNIYDNANGRTVRCAVSYLNVPAPLKQVCYDVTKTDPPAISPSADIATSIDTKPSSTLLVAGIWQINSQTGDLQFCLPCQTSGVVPR
jgi:hypothetical protein